MPGDVVLYSWNLRLLPPLILPAAAFLYVRGWYRANAPSGRLAAFFSGLIVVFIALESPLDNLGHLFLWVHMAQHMLLMIAAPLLIVYGQPWTMLIRGLPVEFVREGLGPFLKWKPVRYLSRWLAAPVTAWLAYALTLVVWHLPGVYQLALASPAWHNVQHACFFWAGVLFWSPVVSRNPRTPRWFAIPYLLLADILNTAFSAWLVFSSRILYPVYESVRVGSMRASTDQVIAGAVMWVPGSLFFVLPAIGIAYTLLAAPSRSRLRARRTARRSPWFDLDLRPIRRFARPLMLIAAGAMIVDGFAGSRSAANAIWFQWRALAILVLLAIGNLFCMACPLTLVRDIARKLVPPRAPWPFWLRNKWIAVGLFVTYLWTYTHFSLWNRPVATAWIVIGYFFAIVSIDCIFTGSSFCKYVCPVGQFNFLVSAVSPREIGMRDPVVCTSCRTHDCARGNQTSRGCELNLFQPTKAGNLDCTFCLDCVSACPSSNVALVPLPRLATIAGSAWHSRISRVSKRHDVAALAAVFSVGAFVNAAQMLALSASLRTLFVTAPALAIALCFAANALAIKSVQAMALLRRAIFALIPLGVAMWFAHLLYHAAPAALSLTSIRDLQIIVLDAGLLLSIIALWKVTNRLVLAIPWQLLYLLLYVAGIWIVFQPMQMGMSM